MSKKYTIDQVISILDFAKSSNETSDKILTSWVKDKNNRIEEKDKHGLSVVGIFEHPITNKDNQEIGRIIVFNYTGVGGGWENDIFNMVQEKYFNGESAYSFRPEGFGGCYRFFLSGDDIFSDENYDKWDKPTADDDFRIFKQELPDSELIITCDISDNRIGAEMNDNLRRNKDYTMYYDESACLYFIKNIHGLKYEPSKPIIEKRIQNRKNNGTNV